jgi:hypothetical protein
MKVLLWLFVIDLELWWCRPMNIARLPTVVATADGSVHWNSSGAFDNSAAVLGVCHNRPADDFDGRKSMGGMAVCFRMGSRVVAHRLVDLCH